MSKVLKRSITILLCITLVFTLAACGKTETINEKIPVTATEEQEETPEEITTTGNAEYAVILKVLSSPFWQSIKTGIEEEAAKQGVKVDVYAASSEDDVEGQVALLENAISKGYKAIAVAPISADNLNPAIAQAGEKGIYIINIDQMVNMEGLKELGGAVQAFVATDNIEVGRMGAEYIVKQLDGAGQVAVIEGKAGAASGEDRKAGATEGFNKEGIELVESQPADWDRTKAYDLATNFINKYPDLKGIYACNDTMAMGALEAVKSSGKDIVVVGTDGNDDAVESVKAGELNATVAQDPVQIGARGMQLMVETVAAAPEINPDNDPIMESIKAVLITKD